MPHRLHCSRFEIALPNGLRRIPANSYSVRRELRRHTDQAVARARLSSAIWPA
jgi:hypothetical protein